MYQFVSRTYGNEGTLMNYFVPSESVCRCHSGYFVLNAPALYRSLSSMGSFNT